MIRKQNSFNQPKSELRVQKEIEKYRREISMLD